jgi:hypothetical protein
MKNTNSRLLAGMILLVIGVAVLVFGIIAWNNARASLGGTIQRVLTGNSPGEQRAIVEMIGGGAAAVIGLVLVATRRSGRRR